MVKGGLSMVFQVRHALRDVSGAMVGAYGHVADGDLHFNPITPLYDPHVSCVVMDVQFWNKRVF